jgi:hypothetical protein
MVLSDASGTGGGDARGAASAFPLAGGGSGSGLSAPGGGGGGGVPGGGGGGGVPGGIPEIDPASAGVGLSVLIGLMLLLVDLFRPR